MAEGIMRAGSMKGYIYISGAFKTIEPSCDSDNDPHFWTNPPTWGICRTDIRPNREVGDYIFFVLPKESKLPQMIYGYFKVAEKITHLEAYHREELRRKRMRDKKPNGNIIVTADGKYNDFDRNYHKDRFNEIKNHYIVGDNRDYESLSKEKIKRLEPDFCSILNKIFKVNRSSVHAVLTQKGRTMSEDQVEQLLDWLQE